MRIKNLLFVLFVSFYCFYILMISKLLDVMILNKSLLLYINHFLTQSTRIFLILNECFYLNRETKLQHITETKQNKTMELLTPAMICCLTLFQGFNQTTLCYCYNRRRGKKAQPRQAKPFSTCAFKSFINEKNKII